MNKTVEQYCAERGVEPKGIMQITQDRLIYLEKNIERFSQLMPEIGKIYIVLDEEGLVDEAMSKTLQDLSQLNYQRQDMLDKLMRVA